MMQSGGFLGSLLSKVAIPSAKNVLAPLGITGAASAIPKKCRNSKKKNTWFWNNNFNNFK